MFMAVKLTVSIVLTMITVTIMFFYLFSMADYCENGED